MELLGPSKLRKLEELKTFSIGVQSDPMAPTLQVIVVVLIHIFSLKQVKLFIRLLWQACGTRFDPKLLGVIQRSARAPFEAFSCKLASKFTFLFITCISTLFNVVVLCRTKHVSALDRLLAKLKNFMELVSFSVFLKWYCCITNYIFEQATDAHHSRVTHFRFCFNFFSTGVAEWRGFRVNKGITIICSEMIKLNSWLLCYFCLFSAAYSVTFPFFCIIVHFFQQVLRSKKASATSTKVL